MRSRSTIQHLIGNVFAEFGVLTCWHPHPTDVLARCDFRPWSPCTIEHVHVLHINQALRLWINEFGTTKLDVSLKRPGSLEVLREFIRSNIVKPLALIVAHSINRVIGKNNKLPWHISGDLKRFKRITSDHAIIMGRKTWESIGSKPLPKRHNIILTRDPSFQAEGAIVVRSREEALDKAYVLDPEPIVIGGESIYREFMPLISKMYITRVNSVIDGDAFFPDVDTGKWSITLTENYSDHDFIIRERII